MLSDTCRYRTALAVWVAALVVGTLASGHVHAADNRGYSATTFMLELDGASVGFLRSFEGGGAVAEVVVDNVGTESVPKKRVANVHYRDIVIEVGFEAGAPLYQWIADAVDGKAPRHSGAIVTLGPDGKAIEKLRFDNALLTGVKITAADAQAKDAGVITLRFVPERPRVEAAAGGEGRPSQSKAKAWLTNGFRFELENVDTTGVVRVDGLEITWPTGQNDTGGDRFRTHQPGKVDFANLHVTVSASGAQGFTDWHKSFVVDGRAGDEQEKNAALVFLTPDLKTELARLTFTNVGILSADRSKVDARTNQPPQVEVELYSERVRFTMPGLTGIKPLRAIKAGP